MEKKSHVFRNVALGIFGFIVFLGLASTFDKPDLTSSASSHVSDSKENTTSTNQDVAYIPTTITDLVNNPSPNKLPIIQTTGIIEKRGKFIFVNEEAKINDTNYYLQVGDGSLSVLVRLNSNTLDQYRVGDKITVKAATGYLGSCSDTTYNNAIGKVCTQFNVWNQKSVPVLITFEPNGINIDQKSKITTDSISQATNMVSN